MKMRLAISLLGFTLAAVPAPAEEQTHSKPSCRPSGPPSIACYAVPSDKKGYDGYYVGGGVPCFGSSRCLTEGTWGWDYPGCFSWRKIDLHWTHGKRYQGGIGAYRTVGKAVGSQSTP